MKKTMMMIAVAALAVSLTVGAVSAQDASATQSPGTGAGLLRNRPGVVLNILQDVVSAISTDTGLSRAELLQQIRGMDSTLAQIIEANGGDVSGVAEDIVAALTDKINQAVQNNRITQARADQLLANLDQRVTDALNRDLQSGGVVAMEMRRIFQDRALMSAVSDATGLQPREILQQVRDGKTLGEVVTDNGGSTQAVIATALATVKGRLDTAVQNGRLTQEQEDQWLARLETAYSDAMNGTLREALLQGAI